MTIKVINPGMLSTFQDTGRHGFKHWGVSVTGVMDEDAHALCHLLVGTPRTFSTLEMTLRGPTRLSWFFQPPIAAAKFLAKADRPSRSCSAALIGRSLVKPNSSMMNNRANFESTESVISGP